MVRCTLAALFLSASATASLLPVSTAADTSVAVSWDSESAVDDPPIALGLHQVSSFAAVSKTIPIDGIHSDFARAEASASVAVAASGAEGHLSTDGLYGTTFYPSTGSATVTAVIYVSDPREYRWLTALGPDSRVSIVDPSGATVWNDRGIFPDPVKQIDTVLHLGGGQYTITASCILGYATGVSIPSSVDWKLGDGAPVPEPASLLLFTVGTAAYGWRHGSRRRSGTDPAPGMAPPAQALA